MHPLPVRPSFSQLKSQARRLRQDWQSGASEAIERIQAHHPEYSKLPAAQIPNIDLSLRDAQLVIAREYGFPNWAEMKKKVEEEVGKSTREERVAERIKKQTSAEEEIERVVLAASGSGVLRKERITRGFSCEVWWVTTVDGQELMYRANWYAYWDKRNEMHFENERWALHQCEVHGIPAPRFLHIEHKLPGYPYRSVIVNTRLDGEPLKRLMERDRLSDGVLESLLTEAGRLLGKLHQLPTNGFRQLDGNGKGSARDWRDAYLGQLDLNRLRQSADNAGLPWSLVQEGIRLLEDNASLGSGIRPCLLHGQFDLEHIIVHNGHVSGLIDFEYCEGGDPAFEMNWSENHSGESWWDPFTGETSPTFPTWPLLDGYRQVATVDSRFQERSCWLTFFGQLGGLCCHGVNDVNTAGMMDFLNWRYRQDLDNARKNLS